MSGVVQIWYAYASTANSTALQAYIQKLGKLVKHCGGGKGVPLIRLMDRFSKSYGANKVLGEEFVSSVVDMHISDLEPVTMVRVACVLANLVAEKVIDRIAKLILKSDVEKLKGSSLKSKTIELDRVLSKAYGIGQKLFAEGRNVREARAKAFGSL